MDDDTDWVFYDFEEPKKAAAPKPAAVSTSPRKSCPKCGKALGKGGHFHVKACQGLTANDAPV
jgi:hypothetical protein